MVELSEQQIQRAIAKYLDTVLGFGSFWTAINPVPGKTIVAAANSKAMGLKAGVPDILILIDGKTVWVEVKKEGGKLDGRQIQVHREIRDAGGLVFTARSVDDIIEIMEEVKNDAKER